MSGNEDKNKGGAGAGRKDSALWLREIPWKRFHCAGKTRQKNTFYQHSLSHTARSFIAFFFFFFSFRQLRARLLGWVIARFYSRWFIATAKRMNRGGACPNARVRKKKKERERESNAVF